MLVFITLYAGSQEKKTPCTHYQKESYDLIANKFYNDGGARTVFISCSTGCLPFYL